MNRVSKVFALCLVLAVACGGPAKPQPATPAQSTPAPAAARVEGLQIKLASIYVDDLEKALHFYTDVLGFAKKEDVENGSYRWLTVSAPGDAHGAALHLALNDNPAAKSYQQAMFEQNQPAAMFYTDDVKREYERLKARGVKFTVPPSEVMPGVTIAMLEDTCGNLIQITQLDY